MSNSICPKCGGIVWGISTSTDARLCRCARGAYDFGFMVVDPDDTPTRAWLQSELNRVTSERDEARAWARKLYQRAIIAEEKLKECSRVSQLENQIDIMRKEISDLVYDETLMNHALWNIANGRAAHASFKGDWKAAFEWAIDWAKDTLERVK